ncbi:MAG: saccharopine dehydrogenase [Sphingobium sp.]|nr:MAG: saccharopine dehydrogenase [Sphingobium sp.]
MAQEQYDLVIYGATGFTGALVSQYLHARAGDEGLRWAMAGRAMEKLAALRDEIGCTEAGLIEADAADSAALAQMVAATRAVVSTVGPYQLHGEPLVEACANAGKGYVDLCGEPLWMRAMIDRYEGIARANGARILFSCGFDSIPAELGVWACQAEAVRTLGHPLPRIRGRMRTFVGGPSGGSVASGMAMMELAREDPAKGALLADPYALTPGFAGPAHPEYNLVEDEAGLGPVGPFTLGPTDMKNVHRSNLLQGHPYGTDFVYDEKLVNPPPPPSQPLSLDKLPKPGEGPSAEVMANGRFDLLIIGEEDGAEKVHVVVKGDQEPGYKTTSMLISETAFALLAADNLSPGIWTPIAALGSALADRIARHTPVVVTLENSGV